MEKRERFVPRFVLCITSLLSVSTRSNCRAAVAGNCSSLLPGAARVQSRIHEFLVCSPPPPPLRSFFVYVSTSTSASTPLFRATAWSPIFCVPCVHCARRISHTQNWRKKSLDVNRGRAHDDRKMQSVPLLYLLSRPYNE